MIENFGRYQLVERIALGGFAEIFKAQAAGIAGFEKTLAIKRLHPRYSQDSDFIAWMVDEAKITSQLSHTNICQVLDFAKVDGHYFIAMEYIEGRDVYRVMKKLRESKTVAPIELVAFIGREACQALDYTHRKRDAEGTPLDIVHRDMSPQNVMISLDGDVKIIDFGIAKSRVRAYETEAGIIKGKFFYMSPEQARGEDLDARTDIFSLGIVLWELVTGELLYKDDDEVTLLSQVRRAAVSPPNSIRSDIPSGLNRIIMKALNRDRNSRYESAFEMQKDLERFLVRHNSKYGATQVGYWMRSTFYDELPAKVIENIESFRNRADFVAEEYSLIGEVSPGNERARPQTDHGSDIVELGSDMIESLEGSSVIVSQGVGAGDEFYDDAPTAAVDGIEDVQAATPMAGLHVPSARAQETAEAPVPLQSAQPSEQYGQGQSASLPNPASVSGAPWEKKETFEYSPTEIGDVAPSSRSHGAPTPKGNRVDAHKKQTLTPQSNASGAQLLGRFRNEAVYVAIVLLLIFGAVLSVTMMWKSGSKEPGVEVATTDADEGKSSSFFDRLIDSIFGDDQGTDQTECAEFNIVDGRKVCASEGGGADIAGAGVDKVNASRSRLKITTNPSGATVFVNETRYPSMTPTVLSRKPDESLRITLSLPSYQTVNEVVRMPAAGKVMELNRTLEKPFGTLVVKSNPSGADIYVNEAYKEQTPNTIRNLRLDRTQVLRITKKGYRDQEQVIRWASAEESAERNIQFDLVRMRKRAPRRVTPRRASKRTVRNRPKPRPSRRKAAPIERRREPAARRGKGRVRVQTRPWSSVYLNGRQLARETPVSTSVEEGSYRLKVCFEGDNRRCVTRRVRVEANQETLERFRE